MTLILYIAFYHFLLILLLLCCITLEPKCKIYYPDNQIRNNGNSMD